MSLNEVSAWGTYEQATAKKARQLGVYRQASIVRQRRSSTSEIVSTTARIDIKELEECANEADLKKTAGRRNYNKQFPYFFDTLDIDREEGVLGGIEEGFVKKDLSPSVQENLLTIFSVYFEGHLHFEEKERKKNDTLLQSVLKKINGTMPGCQSYIMNQLPLPRVFLFAELCLRGIGQGTE